MSADPIHVTLSPPPNERDPLWYGLEHDTENAMRLARKKARRLAKRAGIRGGVLVFHAHRCKWQDPDRGRYDRAELTWSPHWHVVGGGWVVGVAEIHADTGWVVKNHGTRTDTEGTIEYLMDHCAWVDGRDALTYFGHATPAYTRVEKLESYWEKCHCRGCGAQVTRYAARTLDARWDEPLGERMYKTRLYLVTSPVRNDKWPLEFRSSEQELIWRLVKPPPDARLERDLTSYGLVNHWSAGTVDPIRPGADRPCGVGD